MYTTPTQHTHAHTQASIIKCAHLTVRLLYLAGRPRPTKDKICPGILDMSFCYFGHSTTLAAVLNRGRAGGLQLITDVSKKAKGPEKWKDVHKKKVRSYGLTNRFECLITTLNRSHCLQRLLLHHGPVDFDNHWWKDQKLLCAEFERTYALMRMTVERKRTGIANGGREANSVHTGLLLAHEASIKSLSLKYNGRTFPSKVDYLRNLANFLHKRI